VLNPPKGGLSSFGNAGSSTISGLKTTTRAFGAAADEEEDESGDEGEVDHDNSGEAPDKEDAEKSKQSEQKKQINLVPREGKFTRARLLGSTDLVVVETGEENEESIWVGRGRLFIFQEKGWKECGVGPLKFNISKDKPKRARFILRNDGTNKVVLNAGIRKELKVGDEQGEKPADGKLFFMVPTADKSIKKHVIRVRSTTLPLTSPFGPRSANIP
jgi:Ran-binding protein 3